MRREYSPDELLPLSGVQHFVFCRRQWALIHVERQWQENALTAEGKLLHDKADDPFFSEVREGIVIARAMPVASYRLGLIGVCDVVEFTPSQDGVNLPGRQGTFRPAPVEYKRGRPKKDLCDEAQLCAQALCLEEMLSVSIPAGNLYYGEIRHRVEIKFSEDLKNVVEQSSEEMHRYMHRGHTPKVRRTKACVSCSLVDICVPSLQEEVVAASKYIDKQIDRD